MTLRNTLGVHPPPHTHTSSLYCLVTNQPYESEFDTPYSWKYWQELNLAVGYQIAISNVLADLNLAVWYRIAVRIYASRKLIFGRV